ncbi:MAG: RNA polymerase sigma factor YlaC [Phycisphaerae bacterium]|nr:RNA polymerase sigma factor YlaC [Phycisphaerae bacterium]
MGESENSTTSRADGICALVARWQGPLLSYARRVTGDAERAREVVQDTFVRFVRERAAADREQSAPAENHAAAWLFAVCRRRAIDVRRKERRMKAVGVIEADELTRPGGTAESPPEAVERRDTGEQVRALLAGLPERQQEVLRLKFQAGLSYKDIATVTKLSASNVGFLIHTAIRALRARMGEG